MFEEIMEGDVMFANNLLMCHENTIDWRDIFRKNTSEYRVQVNLPSSKKCWFLSFLRFEVLNFDLFSVKVNFNYIANFMTSSNVLLQTKFLDKILVKI